MTRRLAILALPAIGAVLAAATVLPAWQAELKSQIAKSEQCQVTGFGAIRLAVVNGKEAVAARVRCKDKRVFEATRSGAGTPFAFRECKAGAC